MWIEFIDLPKSFIFVCSFKIVWQCLKIKLKKTILEVQSCFGEKKSNVDLTTNKTNENITPTLGVHSTNSSFMYAVLPSGHVGIEM